jgi:hypothetical protein
MTARRLKKGPLLRGAFAESREDLCCWVELQGVPAVDNRRRAEQSPPVISEAGQGRVAASEITLMPEMEPIPILGGMV